MIVPYPSSFRMDKVERKMNSPKYISKICIGQLSGQHVPAVSPIVSIRLPTIHSSAA